MTTDEALLLSFLSAILSMLLLSSAVLAWITNQEIRETLAETNPAQQDRHFLTVLLLLTTTTLTASTGIFLAGRLIRLFRGLLS